MVWETAKKVLRVSSRQRKKDKEIWWWNEDMQESVQRKRLVKKELDNQRDEQSTQDFKEMQLRA